MISLTLEVLANLRRKAEAAKDVAAITLTDDDDGGIHGGPVADFSRAITPTVVLAMLDKIAELEDEAEHFRNKAVLRWLP